MRQYLRCAASVILPFQRSYLTLQRPLVDVPANSVIDLDHRSQGALPETGHRAHGEFLVRSGQRQLVRIRRFLAFIEPEAEFQTQALQQVARVAGVASSPTTDANCVVAL